MAEKSEALKITPNYWLNATSGLPTGLNATMLRKLVVLSHFLNQENVFLASFF